MFSDMTPFRKCLLVSIILIMIAAMIFTPFYLPYKAYKDISVNCVQASTGTVIDPDDMQHESVYYYGPLLEYSLYVGTELVHVRSKPVNTVDLKRVWAKGENVKVLVDPNDISQVIIAEDNTAESRFKIALWVSAAVLSAGLIIFIIGIFKGLKKPVSRSYYYTPDGKTFEQWQEEQKLKEDDVADEAEENSTDSGEPDES